MTAAVLAVNAGSTSVKISVIGPREQTLATSEFGALPASADELAGALRDLTDAFDVELVAHRVVHGGPRTEPAVVDEGLIKELSAMRAADPLHTGPALDALAAAREVVDGPHVACFDTAFHATMPPAAATYALPERWRARYGLHRYGFHGLSHAYGVRRTIELAGPRRQIVSCHLGGGASLAAVADGRSVATTMGFTPLEGLVMNTRSGDVDPGIILWLLTEAGLPAAEVAHGLERESGLLGLAGRDASLAELYTGGERDLLAVAVYVHRLAAGIAAMTASLGGLDGLLFTGGIGEHTPRLRQDVAARLRYLDVAVDEPANVLGEGDRLISTPGAAVAVTVVHAREDLEMARAARALIG